MSLPSLVENQQVNVSTPFHQEAVFRFCTIEGVREGQGLDGALIWCTVQGFDWYAPLFNSIVIANTSFKDMVFSGASFRMCRLVECTFERCRFAPNNLGGATVFDDCTFTECSFVDCDVANAPNARQVFTKSRWYGCSKKRCKGFDGLF